MSITVNGIQIQPLPDVPIELLAAQELLRQRAIESGLLKPDATDESDIQQACEALLAREVLIPTPNELDCQRYYDNHPAEFISGDLVHVRHILFQTTSATPIPGLRSRAEETLNTLLAAPDRFSEMASTLSNCPSSKQGGNLGQLGRGDIVREFEKAVFQPGKPPGLLPELVKTRFGFHIVSVDHRIPGKRLPFDVVRDQIAKRLTSNVDEKAVRQYVSVLVARAVLEGVELEAASSPLVQ